MSISTSWCWHDLVNGSIAVVANVKLMVRVFAERGRVLQRVGADTRREQLRRDVPEVGRASGAIVIQSENPSDPSALRPEEIGEDVRSLKRRYRAAPVDVAARHHLTGGVRVVVDRVDAVRWLRAAHSALWRLNRPFAQAPLVIRRGAAR